MMSSKLLEVLRLKVSALLGKKHGGAETGNSEPICCSDVVHIAFRGLSDDRMYCCYNRNWSETKFFKQNGLRVFCAKCRRRIV